MFIQIAGPNGWSQPQDVLDSRAIVMLNEGTAKLVQVQPRREFTSRVAQGFENAAKYLRLR